MPAATHLSVADLADPAHRKAVVDLLDMYSRDRMGNTACLSPPVRDRLIQGLREHPTSLVLLAFKNDEAIGISVCFRVFSTFLAAPVLNIHDIAVHPRYRNQGIGGALLDAIQEQALEMGCCKITLEVREDNETARHLYRAAGFRASAPEMHFWHKPLSG